MKKEFKHFLETTQNIKVRAYRQGILFFDYNRLGTMGYLFIEGDILKIPITLEVLTEKEIPIL